MKNKMFLSLLFLAILLRFILQFVFPVFNVDEISLGNNIKHLNFIELLYPLQYAQSSPPLFLWLEKIIVMFLPFSFWINIKILSFISSVTGLVLFYLLAEKYNFKVVFLLLFIIFAFNPFNINNSLTVKQYTVDLTGVMFLLVYFRSKSFKQINWVFFMLWCLMSNIGLFASTGYLLYLYFDEYKKINISNLLIFFRVNRKIFLAPIPYVIYFLWFMKQKGAIELKEYMQVYWDSSFIPFNRDVFHYLIYMIHGLWIFIFNSFEIIGFFLMLLMVSFFVFCRKKQILFKEEIFLLFSILFVHLFLNVLHMYPFSDRLYLYLSPLFLLVLGSSLNFYSKFEIIKKYFKPLVVVISFILLMSYFLYLPANDNDVVSLNKKLSELNVDRIYVSKKCKGCIEGFNQFTENKFVTSTDLILLDKTLDKSNFIVSRVAKKLKMGVSSLEEKEVQGLVDAKKIVMIDAVNGYNIYKVN